MAAAISATQARNPITLRTSRAVINRCPIGDAPYRAAPALADGAFSFDHLVGAHRGRGRGHLCTTAAGDKVISPPPIALVEGRRRGQWCLPGTTDSLGTREAKVPHQVNQVVAQSEIRRHPVDRFYAHHFDLRQGRCRRFGRPHRRRLLRMRMCCKRPCRSQPSQQTDELAPLHSITSSASCWRCKGTSRPSALALFRLMTSSNLVGSSIGISDALLPFNSLFTTEPARRHTS